MTVLPLPSISSVSPASFPAGSFTLTVNGAGFTPDAVVSFGGAQLPTTFVSSSRLTATGTAAASPSVPVFATMTDGTVSNTVTVTVTAPIPPPVVGVSVSPATATVRIKQTRQFTATVTGTSNTSVVWKVNGIAGGNTTVGRVSQSGVYTAPRRVPSPATVTVSATSVADPTKSASAQVDDYALTARAVLKTAATTGRAADAEGGSSDRRWHALYSVGAMKNAATDPVRSAAGRARARATAVGPRAAGAAGGAGDELRGGASRRSRCPTA